MRFNLSKCAFTFLLILFFVECKAQIITDIIKPIKLNQEKSDSILLSDIFYSKNYDINFIKNNYLNAQFDKNENVLIMEPLNKSRSALLLDFKLEDAVYSIPIFMENSNEITHYKFQYKPEKKIETVTVAGSFNNWNRKINPLTDTDGDGIYETEIPLEPGSYIYKFSVDGVDILDPDNDNTEPTGFDGFNSVLKIKEREKPKNYLYLLGKEENEDSFTINFMNEKEKDSSSLEINNIIALLNNQKLSPSKIKIEGKNISVNLEKADLRGEKVLRLLIADDNSRTNMQSIFFYNGKAAGNENEHFNWKDGSIYSIMIDRFNDGDTSINNPVKHDSLFWQANYEGGDLQGIINKINDGYIDSLGTNIIWISPVYDNPNQAYREYPKPYRWYSGYHGYWPIDENKVEEKFGTIEKLKELVSIAHQHGIKVLLDIVAHHVHIENPIFKEHPDWFGTLDLPNGRKNLRLWDEYRLTTWFEPYMPSFDYTQTEAPIDFMTDNCIWWLKESGADGFRHDAVKHVPNRFWRALTKKLNEEIEVPFEKKVYQIGETFGDYKLIGSYVNNGQLSAQFDFNLSYSAIPIFLEKEKSFADLDVAMDKALSAFGYHHVMGNIMDSHDKVRFIAYADGDVPKQGVDMREMAWTDPPKVDHASSYKKAELYYSFMFTIPGIPVIYYGSEFGMTGADDPDNRRFMRFGNELDEDEKAMLKVTSKIVNLRNEHSALRYGDFKSVFVDDNVYVYMRVDINEKLLIVLNKSEEKQNVEFKIPKVYNSYSLIDVISKENVNVEDNISKIGIDGYGWRVFKLK